MWIPYSLQLADRSSVVSTRRISLLPLLPPCAAAAAAFGCCRCLHRSSASSVMSAMNLWEGGWQAARRGGGGDTQQEVVDASPAELSREKQSPESSGGQKQSVLVGGKRDEACDARVGALEARLCEEVIRHLVGDLPNDAQAVGSGDAHASAAVARCVVQWWTRPPVGSSWHRG